MAFSAVASIRRCVRASLSSNVLQCNRYSDAELDGRVSPSSEASSFEDLRVYTPFSGEFPPAVPNIQKFGADKPADDRNSYRARSYKADKVHQNVNSVSGRVGHLRSAIVKPQHNKTTLNEEESSVGNWRHAFKNVPQESCDNAPMEDSVSSKELRIGSDSGRDSRHLRSSNTTTEAIAILKHRQQQGLYIDSYMFIEILKRCSDQKDFVAARQVHDCIIQSGMEKNPYVATTLLNLYVKCGRLQDARAVFDELEKSSRSVITWNVMIGGYAKRGFGVEASRLFLQMKREGLNPNAITYVTILNAKASASSLEWVKEVHGEARKAGLEADFRLGSALVHMYAKSGSIDDARLVFDRMERRDVITWTTMIGAYAENGCGVEAYELFLRMKREGFTPNVITWNVTIGAYAKSGRGVEAYKLFLQMKREGFTPNAITYMNILNASASAGALEWVREVHSDARRAALESDFRVSSALVHMYAKSGSIDDARLVFDRMEKRDVITWTTMIGAYAGNGCGMEAYQLFLQMKREGFKPDAITYMSILNPSASARALEWVKEVHGDARKAGLESDFRVSSALVHMYAKCGRIDDARLVFDRMLKRDVITWNIMIGAYAELGCGVEAYKLLLRMEREGFKPNANTYVSILNASVSEGALEWVKEVHSHAIQAGLESDLGVGTALVHMYANSGFIDDARLIFEKMTKRDVVTWTTMIGGLAHHGYGHQALELFNTMNAHAVKPDGTTFVAVLSACCHAGLVDDGRRLFSTMMKDYGIEPTVVHYSCMVDLLGRAGQLEEAKLLIRTMPIEPNGVTWQALLGACRTYGNVELGELAAKELLKLEPKNASAYVLLSNIYAAAGKWEKVSSVRTMMQETGVRKEPGRSWLEADNKIHEFVSGDSSHPEARAIYNVLKNLTEKLKTEGYIPQTQLVLQDICEEDKELALCSHSERLAIAYGILHVPHGKPIRVFKNLRVCSDCHTATKFISKVTGREIIARDANRFHHFKDGMCSCGDYW